ncbi:MAG: phosphate ABC transporter substrate-binding protein [Gemmatimonadaceae bacterium]|nr:phosphate ABC transporter substrate-binding protein [Gemmatimonadaceae bacterium]
MPNRTLIRCRISAFLRVAVCTVMLANCAKGAPEAIGEVVLAGSTSIQPFAERWAEEYRDGRITVQSGGSTAGIKAAHDGTADVGMSSRQLHPAETAGLQQTVVARDGIAVIVHASNPVRSLTLAQLRAIYGGDIRRWSEVGGDSADITVITREEGSGTRDTFQEIVMGARVPIAREALVTAYSGGLRKMVAEDPHAIGYVTFSQLNDRVHAIALDGVTPTEASIRDATYRLQRPFLFLTRGRPNAATTAFLQFVLSPRGQSIARAEGLAPVATY